MIKIQLELGAMAPDISEQLDAQGLFLPNDFYYQNALDAATRLFLGGFITQSAADKARDKIVKSIIKSVKRKPQ